jgi:hypothetical protein
MFNAKAIIEFEIPTSEGMKLAKLRMPTDQEWADRSRQKKIVQRNVGRGQTQIEQVDYSSVDLALFAAIKQEGSAEIDGYEAQMLLDRISYAEVIDLERHGGQYRITLATAAGDTVHLVRVPSAKEIMEYRRSFARVVDLPYGRQQIVINLPAAGSCYDSLSPAIEGYSDSVPLVHKSAVVRAAIDAVEQATGDDGGRVNFR